MTRPLIAVLILLFASASNLTAGTMRTFAKVAARFDQAFNLLPFVGLTNGPISSTDGAGIYQIDVVFEATNEAGNKGWASTLFNVGLFGGVTNGGGWGAVADTFDSNGAAPGGLVPIYATNGDSGSDTADLQNIIVSISGAGFAASDGRNKLGTAGAPLAVGFPTKLGSIFVEFNGVSSGRVAIKDLTYSFTNLDGTFAPVQQGEGDTIFFGGPVMPEMVSIPTTGQGIKFGDIRLGDPTAVKQITLSNPSVGDFEVFDIRLVGQSASNFFLTGTLPTRLTAGEPPKSFGIGLATSGVRLGYTSAQLVIGTN